jgi:hypothetical protein
MTNHDPARFGLILANRYQLLGRPAKHALAQINKNEGAAMLRPIKIWMFALLCVAPMYNASAKVIRMEIDGSLGCGVYNEEEVGRGDYGCERFADYFGLKFFPNQTGGGDAGGSFVIKFKIDLAAAPTTYLNGRWLVGNKVMGIGLGIRERWGDDYFSEGCDGDFAIVSDDFEYPVFLCSGWQSSLLYPTWQEIALLSDAELAGFQNSGSYDFILRGGAWSGGWSLDSIRRISRVAEPGTLALLGFGLAGLGLTRRRKAD